MQITTKLMIRDVQDYVRMTSSTAMLMTFAFTTTLSAMETPLMGVLMLMMRPTVPLG